MLRTRAAIAATALLLSACASGSSREAVIEDNLRAHEQAQDALRERVKQLEAQLDSNRPRDTSGEMEALSTKVTELSQAVTALRNEVDERTAGDEDLGASLRADIGKVSDQLDLLAETLSGVSADLTRVEADLGKLRKTVDDHIGRRNAHR